MYLLIFKDIFWLFQTALKTRKISLGSLNIFLILKDLTQWNVIMVNTFSIY